MNGLNQYTSAGPASFGYDANGNLISDGTGSYTYDAENRLVSASNGAVLSYDPAGRLWRVTKGAADTRLLYDGDALVAEYDAAGTLTQRYVHGSDTQADDPLLWYDHGTARWLHDDHQGSIVAATNGTGGTPAINTYDEYGIPGISNTGRFQYTGQAWLTELGMYYYKARIYSPTLGRFLQTDPIGYDDQFNLYAYVGNDPVNRSDPSGKSLTEAAFLIADVVQTVADVHNGASAGEILNDAVNIALDVEPVPGLREAKSGVEVVRAVNKGRETGVIYRRTNRETGRCYIGRCNSEELFARRQRDHDRRLGTRHEYEVVERAKPGPSLRQAEQRQIDAHGGPTNRSNPNGGAENKRNEIAPCRGTRIGNFGTGSIC